MRPRISVHQSLVFPLHSQELYPCRADTAPWVERPTLFGCSPLRARTLAWLSQMDRNRSMLYFVHNASIRTLATLGSVCQWCSEPIHEGPFEECAVSTRVNSVRNDDPGHYCSQVGDRTLFTRGRKPSVWSNGTRHVLLVIFPLFFRSNFPVRLFQIPCSVILNSLVISEQGIAS